MTFYDTASLLQEDKSNPGIVCGIYLIWVHPTSAKFKEVPKEETDLYKLPNRLHGIDT